jgi:O-antigen/teichoic acid export membrane protein
VRGADGPGTGGVMSLDRDPLSPRDGTAAPPAADKDLTKDLRPRTVRAIAWTSAGSLLSQAVTFGSALIVTRIISPGDFGRVALASVVVGILSTVSDTGLGTALVQKGDITKAEERTALTIQSVIGLVAATLLILTSRPLAGLLGSSDLEHLIAALALTIPLQSLASVPRSLLVRVLRMRAVATTDATSALAGASFMVAGAMAGLGAWSLVGGLLTSAAVSTCIVLWLSRQSLRVGFDREALRTLAAFARPFYGYTIVNFLIRNGDNLLVGRFLGTYQLGLYSRAYALLLVPSRQVTSVIGGSLQVALARIASDKERSRRAYLEACEHIAFVVMPVMVTITILASDFVPVVMGEQWHDAIPAVRLLALAGILEPVATTAGWLYFAQGRSDVMFRLSLLFAPLYFVAFGIGVALGSASSAAAAYAVVSALMIPLILSKAGALINLRLRDYLRALRPSLLATVLSGAGMGVARYALVENGAAAPVRLLTSAAVGGVLFLLAAHRLGAPETRMLLRLLARAHSRRTAL